MAERKAVATGNWDAVGTWDGGASIPTTGDIVYLNNFTVTANVDINLGASGEIRTTTGPNPIAGSTPVAGGGVTVTGTVTITANLIAGTTTCVSVNSGALTHTGTIQGGSSTNARGLHVSGTAAQLVSHSGDITGGSASSAAGILFVSNSAPAVGHGTITGNITGGSHSSADGINFSGATQGPIAIVGNLVSGTGPAVSCTASTWTGTPLLTVTGNITGTGTGTGLVVASTSNFNVTVNGKIKAGLGLGASITTMATFTVNNVGGVAVEGSDQGSAVNDFALSISTGTFIVNGDVIGGSSGTGSVGINLGATITSLTVNGNVTGGAAPAAHGITTGAFFASSGFTFSGTVKGGTGSGAFGLNSTSTQGFVFNTIEGNSYGDGTVTNACPGYVCTADNPNARAKCLKFGTHGVNPVSGRIRLVDDIPNNLVIVPRYSDNATINLRQVAYSADFPAESDVRYNVTYDDGQMTGTCHVAGAASTLAGVPTDHTVGTATITADSIRAALGMASANLDAKLAELVGYTDTLEASMATVIGHVDSVEAGVATITGHVDTLESSAATIAGYTDTLEAGVAALSASATTIAGYTDTLESGVAQILSDTALIKTSTDTIPNIPKAVWNFDMLANVGDTVPRYSPRMAIRAILRWFVDVIGKKHRVYKEDGTLAFESNMEITTTDGIIGDDKGA